MRKQRAVDTLHHHSRRDSIPTSTLLNRLQQALDLSPRCPSINQESRNEEMIISSSDVKINLLFISSFNQNKLSVRATTIELHWFSLSTKVAETD